MNRINNAKNINTAVILGNGPSLKGFDFQNFKDFDVFGMNVAYRYWEQIGWYPKYYSCLDLVVGMHHKNAIEEMIEYSDKLNIELFLLRDNLIKELSIKKNAHRIVNFDLIRHNHPALEYKRVTTGSHTTAWATALGYKDIYLMGIDCNYKQFVDGSKKVDGTVLEIEKECENPNYFFKGYQQTGDKYNIPNPSDDLHLISWKEVSKLIPDDVAILNANPKSALDVFNFVDPKVIFQKNKLSSPICHSKLLIFDMTKIGDGTATGEIKANILQEYPKSNLLQVYRASDNQLGVFQAHNESLSKFTINKFDQISQIIDNFNPDVILFRPTPNIANHNPFLNDFATHTINRIRCPLITWVMDDWPEDLRINDPNQFAKMDSLIRDLFSKSSKNFSISDVMSKCFEERYGVEFEALANGVNINEWDIMEKEIPSLPIRIRYCGAIAENMCLQSILRIAQAIEEIANHYNVIFEINTRFTIAKILEQFKNFKHTHFTFENYSRHDYYQWLKNADITLLGYNFDEASLNYIRYSIANKAPECLASGAATLAFGPEEAATIKHLKSSGSAAVVYENDDQTLKDELIRLVSDKDYREELARNARKFVLKHHNLIEIQQRFIDVINSLTPNSSNTTPIMNNFRESKTTGLIISHSDMSKSHKFYSLPSYVVQTSEIQTTDALLFSALNPHINKAIKLLGITDTQLAAKFAHVYKTSFATKDELSRKFNPAEYLKHNPDALKYAKKTATNTSDDAELHLRATIYFRTHDKGISNI